MRKILPILLMIFCLCGFAFAGHFIQKFTTAGGGPDEWIGYETIGSYYTTESSTNLICSALDSPSSNGTVTIISIYSSNTSAGQDVKVGLYEDNAGTPDAIVGTEAEFVDTGTWSVGWKDFSGLSFPIVSAKSYWLCWNANSGNSITTYYDIPAGTNRHYDTVSDYDDAWPSTYDSASSGAGKWSIKAYVD